MDIAVFRQLVQWKDAPDRISILLHGARQVGKNYLVEQLGNAYFQTFHNINFEHEPEYKQCFETLARILHTQA